MTLTSSVVPSVLIWNQYFPPDTSATSALAKSLADAFEQRGWDVQVLAGNPSYRPTVSPSWRGLAVLRAQGNKRVVRSTRFSRERMWGRVANYASFILLSFLPAMRTKADVIVAMTDPPVVVLPAVVVGKIKRTPVLYWLQDYLPEFLIGIGQATDRGVFHVWSLAHHAATKRCSSVVAIGRDMADRLTAAGVPRDIITVVPNGSALEWRDLENEPRNGVPRELVVLHAGEIGMRGAWETIVGGAGELAGVAKLVFLGDGVRADEVRRLASGLPNVTFRPTVPSAEVRGALLDADVLVVTIRRGAEGYTVPSKTYELFGAGKPVLVVGDENTESALLVKEIGCGFIVSPDDPSEFTSAVRTLAADEALRSEMGGAARSASAGFARASMMQRIVDQVEMLTPAT